MTIFFDVFSFLIVMCVLFFPETEAPRKEKRPPFSAARKNHFTSFRGVSMIKSMSQKGSFFP